MPVATTKLISIEPIHKIGEDERGATYSFKTRNRPSYMLIQRKAGTVSGNQYHWGLNDGTKTRVFILAQGTIEIHYRHVDDLEVQKKCAKGPAKSSSTPLSSTRSKE